MTLKFPARKGGPVFDASWDDRQRWCPPRGLPPPQCTRVFVWCPLSPLGAKFRLWPFCLHLWSLAALTLEAVKEATGLLRWRIMPQSSHSKKLSPLHSPCVPLLNHISPRECQNLKFGGWFLISCETLRWEISWLGCMLPNLM